MALQLWAQHCAYVVRHSQRRQAHPEQHVHCLCPGLGCLLPLGSAPLQVTTHYRPRPCLDLPQLTCSRACMSVRLWAQPLLRGPPVPMAVSQFPAGGTRPAHDSQGRGECVAAAAASHKPPGVLQATPLGTGSFLRMTDQLCSSNFFTDPAGTSWAMHVAGVTPPARRSPCRMQPTTAGPRVGDTVRTSWGMPIARRMLPARRSAKWPPLVPAPWPLCCPCPSPTLPSPAGSSAIGRGPGLPDMPGLAPPGPGGEAPGLRWDPPLKILARNPARVFCLGAAELWALSPAVEAPAAGCSVRGPSMPLRPRDSLPMAVLLCSSCRRQLPFVRAKHRSILPHLHFNWYCMYLGRLRCPAPPAGNYSLLVLCS